MMVWPVLEISDLENRIVGSVATKRKNVKRKISPIGVLSSLVSVYNNAMLHRKHPSSSRVTDDGLEPPPELYVNGLEIEQVWQQLELLNRLQDSVLLKRLRRAKLNCGRYDAVTEPKQTKRLPTTNAASPDGSDQQASPDNSDDDAANSDSEDEPLFRDAERIYNSNQTPAASDRGQTRSSVVDDRFFHLAEMEAFLEQQERPQKEEDEVNLDMFADDSGSDAGAEDVQYDAFFDPPTGIDVEEAKGKTKKTVSFENGDEDGDASDSDDGASNDASDTAKVVYGDDDDDATKGDGTAFEETQRRLRESVSALEEQNLSGKGWQMSGEASAVDRPDNSALEEHLLFEHTTKIAPTITEESTEKLESLIMRRIKDHTWDDVERKEKPKTSVAQYRNDLVLDQEKSKKSLAEVYEEEYLKQTGQKEVDTANPQHEEIRSMMTSLFARLDALSNYCYAPKTPVPEVKLVNNMRSIQMEEVAPITSTEATVLAPEEVKVPTKGGELKDDDERTETDRRRSRRKTKTISKHRAEYKRVKAAAAGGGGDATGGAAPPSHLVTSRLKHQALKQLAPVAKTKLIGTQSKSSTDFFNKLQTEAASVVANGAARHTVKPKSVGGSKYKL